MKFRVERDVLAEAVAWAARSLPARPAVPVLAGLLLEVADDTADRLRLRLRGLRPQVERRRSHAAERRPGAGLRPAAGRDHRGLPPQPVDSPSTARRSSITCGSARFTLPTMPVEDYPTLPDDADDRRPVDERRVRRRGRRRSPSPPAATTRCRC